MMIVRCVCVETYDAGVKVNLAHLPHQMQMSNFFAVGTISELYHVLANRYQAFLYDINLNYAYGR